MPRKHPTYNDLARAERLKEERKKIWESRSDFRTSTGLSDRSLEGWEQGIPFPPECLEEIAKHGGDALYILTGKRQPKTEPVVYDFPDIGPEDFREVPFYPDEIAAGQPLAVRDRPEGVVVIHKEWCPRPEVCVAVRVSSTGRSMEPTIPAGAIVVIDTSVVRPERLIGKIVAIYKGDHGIEEGVTIKRLAQTKRGWCGVPDNRDPDFQIIVIEEGDRIIGKVASVHYRM